MSAYYNENDLYAAQWLRNLIDAGHIARGVVDTRSIEDVRPRDLDGFTQCHFFAGIGVWSYALRLAGWPDDRPVWTGSCPCQPFSEAGKGAGFDDERHLWPHWFHLISQHRPAIVFGEQVASKDADPWIDLVQDDLEGLGHAFGAIPFPSAGVGAPHIRDRLYWVADATQGGRPHSGAVDDARRRARALRNGGVGELAGADRDGREGSRLHVRQRGPLEAVPVLGWRGEVVGLANAQRDDRRCEAKSADRLGPQADGSANWSGGCGGAPGERPGPTNGHWRSADWIACRDGKWRPVEPGALPLAHGAPARVGRLRAYGNAINAQAAAEFIRCVM